MLTPKEIASFQYCPRQRWLGHIDAGGSESPRLHPNDALDRILKPALSRMMCNRTMSIDDQVADAASRYALEVQHYGGLQMLAREDAQYVFSETGALIEALLRAAYRVVRPDFAHIEKIRVPEPQYLQPFQIEARPDLVLEYEHGRAGLFWMIVSGDTAPNVRILRHAISAAVLAHSLNIVEVRYVKRGMRRGKDGRDCIHSPLIRGYRQEKKKNQRPHGTEMEGRAIWETHLGIKGWIDTTPDTILLSQFGLDWAPVDVTDRRLMQYKYTKNSLDLVQMISPVAIQAWRQQVLAQENQVSACVAQMTNMSEKQRQNAIDAYFPQYEHSCRYCEFKTACDRGMLTGLQDGGMFRKRGV